MTEDYSLAFPAPDLSQRPSVISRFWTGREMPEAYKRYGQAWIDLGIGMSLIDDDAFPCEVDEMPPGVYDVIQDIVNRDAGRNGIEMAVQIADVVGYLAVWARGGIYVNCDIQPVRMWTPPWSAWASLENDTDGRIVNAAIGAPHPRDHFWQGLLYGLADRYFADPTAEMVETTGPAYLTDYAHAHPDDITVLPRVTFNPVHWNDIEPGGDANGHIDFSNLPEGTVGVHHWGHKRDGRSNRVETATTLLSDGGGTDDGSAPAE